MNFNIVSLFPEFFDSPLKTSLMARACNSSLLSFSFYNPRDYSIDKHSNVDDRPYGGGPGMVMMLDPLVKSLRSIKKMGRLLLLSPSGKPFKQDMAVELAQEENITIICGRYEGIDARIAQLFDVESISLGDFVLNGGESAALAVVESISRLIPGFMGKKESGVEESFSNNLLEYPHYTRPENYENYMVPKVLCSGDHGKIAKWRRISSLQTTLDIRPELLSKASLTVDDIVNLNKIRRLSLGRNLNIALVHYPVIIEGKDLGYSSLTNLDIHDIARTCCTYGLSNFYVTTPLEDQMQVLKSILHHWLNGAGSKTNLDRKQALSLVRPVKFIEDAILHLTEQTGQKPIVLGSSANWHEADGKIASYNFEKVLDILKTSPVLVLLGTGHGLASQVLSDCAAVLQPLRFMGEYNHLSVRAAAAIMVDRILGDVH